MMPNDTFESRDLGLRLDLPAHIGASDVAVLCGLCAVPFAPDAVAALATAHETRRFRLGYSLAGAVCALILVIELAALARLEAARDRGAVAIAHAAPAAFNAGR